MAKTTAADRRPILLVACGRGKTGKSVLLRWAGEMAIERGRYPLRIWDADPSNQSLAQYFEAAEVPPSQEMDDRRVWLEDRINQMADAAQDGAPFDALLDVGGNDVLLKWLGHDVRLVELLDEHGIDLVAVHMIGPDKDDLSFLADVEASGLFRPKHVAVVLNAGLLSPMQRPSLAFAPIVASEPVKQVMARGGRLATMPLLGCMREIEGRREELRTFRSAAAARRVIGLTNAQRVANWLDREMPEMAREMAGLLP